MYVIVMDKKGGWRMQVNNEEKPNGKLQGGRGVPLGYVEVPGGTIAVGAMNDVFANYHFAKKEHWEDLRKIANIYIEGYKNEYPQTSIEAIEGEITVDTQFVRFKNPDKKTDRQDFKLTGKNITYMELHNEPYTNPTLEEKSASYFGMGIAIAGGKTSNQIWLMAKDNTNLMCGKKYTYYVLADERTNRRHPNHSGIMFVSLTKIAAEDSPAGELSRFLLGKANETENFKHCETKAIAEGMKEGFEKFKEDKEAASMLSFAERKFSEGEARGKIEGKIEVLHTELGLSAAEISKKLNMEENFVKEILKNLGLLEAA